MTGPVFEKCPMCEGKMEWNEKVGSIQNAIKGWNDCASDDENCNFKSDVFFFR